MYSNEIYYLNLAWNTPILGRRGIKLKVVANDCLSLVV